MAVLLVVAAPLLGHRNSVNGELPRRTSGELRREHDAERERRIGRVPEERCLTLSSMETTTGRGEVQNGGNRRWRAAAGDEEDGECRRSTAPGDNSFDEEQQGDEAQLPVHSDALLAVQNAGNGDDHGGTVLVRVSSRGTERGGRGKMASCGRERRTACSLSTRGATSWLGGDGEQRGGERPSSSPRSLQREEEDNREIFHKTP
jgi:hypothetical protein